MNLSIFYGLEEGERLEKKETKGFCFILKVVCIFHVATIFSMIGF